MEFMVKLLSKKKWNINKEKTGTPLVAILGILFPLDGNYVQI